MDDKEIRRYLDPEHIEQIDVAAQVLKISRRAYIQQAIETKLENLDHDRVLVSARDKAYEKRDYAENEAKDARQQRDLFKAKMEEKHAELAVADAKLKVHEKQGWLARLIGFRPKPAILGGMTLDALVRFHYRLKAVGMTPNQIDQILLPLYQASGVPLTLDLDDEGVRQIEEQISEQRSQGRELK